MTEKSQDIYNVEYLERQLHNLSKLVEINRIINSTLDIGKLLDRKSTRLNSSHYS